MNLTLFHSGAAAGDHRSSSTDQKYPLGTLAYGPGDCCFRYAQCAAGGALVAGNAIQGPAMVTTTLAMTAAAAAIGATDVTFTLGGTNAVVANQYAEGFLGADTTPGNGLFYRIASHPAAAASASLTVRLYPDEGLKVAHTTATRLGLVSNVYKSVIQVPATTATGKVVGIAAIALPASEYGWLQTRGLAWPLIANTPALGGIVISPGTAAGALEVSTAVTLLTGQVVGYMMQIGVNAKNNAVWLTLD